VICRTGRGGLGSSKNFPFSEHGGEANAMKKAKAWLEQNGIVLLFQAAFEKGYRAHVALCLIVVQGDGARGNSSLDTNHACR